MRTTSCRPPVPKDSPGSCSWQSRCASWLPGANIRYQSHWKIQTPARNIVGICSRSHEKKVNLGEVFSAQLGQEHVLVGPLRRARGGPLRDDRVEVLAHAREHRNPMPDIRSRECRNVLTQKIAKTPVLVLFPDRKQRLESSALATWTSAAPSGGQLPTPGTRSR